MIMQRIEGKNEEILQKKETHRHKLNEVHEAYKREIQKENERHLDDLKVTSAFLSKHLDLFSFSQVTEKSIGDLRGQLEELEQLNYTVAQQIPCTKAASLDRGPDKTGRLRDLLECPVCMEEMKPPKKIFQCSNGHVICEMCKNNPEVCCIPAHTSPDAPVLDTDPSLAPIPGAKLSNLPGQVPRPHRGQEHCGRKAGEEHLRKRGQ